MNSHITQRAGNRQCMTLVPLSSSFIEALLKLRVVFDDDLVSALRTSLADSTAPSAAPAQAKSPAVSTLPRGKYAAEFLGITVATRTLPEVFARIVDMTAIAAPEALERLARVRTRERRFISRDPQEIHLGNRHLPVMQTTSGWWISKNTGQEDLKRALRALCQTSGIDFGTDVKFPIPKE